MKRLISVITFAVVSLMTYAMPSDPDPHTKINGIWYKLDSVKYCASVVFGSAFDGPGNYKGDISIPDKVVYNNKSYTVVSIGNFTFQDCSITSVTIPETVTSIGANAFKNCKNLTSITLPENLTAIENYLFEGSGLTSFTFPRCVISIGKSVFRDCAALESIDGLHLVDGLTSLPPETFSNCSSLKSVVLPESLTDIGYKAFYNCSSLKSIVLPESLTIIDYYAFSGSGLTSVFIPANVERLGGITYDPNPFNNTEMNSIVVAEDNPFFDSRNNCNAIIETATNTLVSGCKNTIIPDNVTSLGMNAFLKCKGLTTIEIPSTVTNFNTLVFGYCPDLQSVIINSSTVELGEYMFQNCTQLKKLKVSWNRPPALTNGEFSGVSLKDCTLYVPKGTGVMYMSAPKWIEFGNILEYEDESNVHYITIRQGEGGMIRHSVEIGKVYTYLFTADDGWEIHSVSYNGEDVMSQLFGKQFTTPVITGDAELSVVFQKVETGVKTLANESRARVRAFEKTISVTNADKLRIEIYDTGGKLQKTAIGDSDFTLSAGLYIVRVGNDTFKVCL